MPYHPADSRYAEINFLMRLAETLNQTNPPDRALESGLRLVAEQVRAIKGWFLSLNQAGEVEVVARFRPEGLTEMFPEGQRVYGMCRCLHRMLVYRGGPFGAHVVECERLERTYEDTDHPRHHLSIPVQSGGRPVGMINLVLPDERRIPDTEMRFLESLANQFGGALERARLFAETQRALDRERRMNEAARAIAEAFDDGVIYQALLSYAVELSGGTGGAVSMLSQERAEMTQEATHNFQIDLTTFGNTIPGGQSLCMQVMESGRSIMIGTDGLSGYLVSEMQAAGVQHLMMVPIPMNGLMEGVLTISFDHVEVVFDQRELFLVQTLAEQAGVALEKVRLYDEVRRLATIDGLTGLMTRAYFYERAAAEVERSRRYGNPLSVFMIDVDHFKNINDAFGHVVGDHVLQRIAQICTSSLRAVDLIGRLGGEEIAVLMPETELHAALHAAERLRIAISAVIFETNRGLAGVTISIGVTCVFAEERATLEGIIERADWALYEAKEAGRNQVVAWNGHTPSPVALGD